MCNELLTWQDTELISLMGDVVCWSTSVCGSGGAHQREDGV
jgi:hypothetical protein